MPPEYDTLAARVRWVLRERGMSQRGLSLKAGLAESHVGLIVRGNMKQVAAETLRKLARAGVVSFRWLALNEGSPWDIERDDQDTEFETALRVIHTSRWSPAVIAEVVEELQKIRVAETQPRTAVWWIDRALMLARLRGESVK